MGKNDEGSIGSKEASYAGDAKVDSVLETGMDHCSELAQSVLILLSVVMVVAGRNIQSEISALKRRESRLHIFSHSISIV